MIIDSHVHYNENYPSLGYAVIFPLCEDIYERNNPNFMDTNEWIEQRQKANEKNLGINRTIPFLFLWNDFNVTNINKYSGIKIHRHSNEAKYNWETNNAKTALNLIRKFKMPIIIEDEPDRIIYFIQTYAKEINIIIPHLLHYRHIKESGVLSLKNVYVDTSMAIPEEILDYIDVYGVDRIIFGSDWPYEKPSKEYIKILKLGLPQDHLLKIFSKNIIKLLNLKDLNEKI